MKLLNAILRSCPPNAPQEFKDRRGGLERLVMLPSDTHPPTHRARDCNRTLSDLAEALEEKRNRALPERVAHHKDDQQEILCLIREVSSAIEIAMVRLFFWGPCLSTDLTFELDVTVRNEGLILEAVKGIDWLKDRHGECRTWTCFRSPLMALPVEQYTRIQEPIARMERHIAELRKAGEAFSSSLMMYPKN